MLERAGVEDSNSGLRRARSGSQACGAMATVAMETHQLPSARLPGSGGLCRGAEPQRGNSVGSRVWRRASLSRGCPCRLLHLALPTSWSCLPCSLARRAAVGGAAAGSTCDPSLACPCGSFLLTPSLCALSSFIHPTLSVQQAQDTALATRDTAVTRSDTVLALTAWSGTEFSTEVRGQEDRRPEEGDRRGCGTHGVGLRGRVGQGSCVHGAGLSSLSLCPPSPLGSGPVHHSVPESQF